MVKDEFVKDYKPHMYNSIHVSIEYFFCDFNFGSDGFTLFIEFFRTHTKLVKSFLFMWTVHCPFSRTVNPSKQFIDDFNK